MSYRTINFSPCTFSWRSIWSVKSVDFWARADEEALVGYNFECFPRKPYESDPLEPDDLYLHWSLESVGQNVTLPSWWQWTQAFNIRVFFCGCAWTCRLKGRRFFRMYVWIQPHTGVRIQHLARVLLISSGWMHFLPPPVALELYTCISHGPLTIGT